MNTGGGGVIFLDRDGVLNEVVVDPDHGTIDSPLNPDQVRICAGVPEALARLTRAGYLLLVATNQPSAAKGKTTRALLEATHARVLELAQSAGGRITESYICFHRAEDRCSCRKPAPGLLESGWAEHGQGPLTKAWMVGDGVTDVQAARSFGCQAGFLGPRKCDACKIMEDRSLKPEFWGRNLPEFVDFLGC